MAAHSPAITWFDIANVEQRCGLNSHSEELKEALGCLLKAKAGIITGLQILR